MLKYNEYKIGEYDIMNNWNNWIEDIKQSHVQSLKYLEKKILTFSNLRGISFLLVFISAIYSFNYPRIYLYHILTGLLLLSFLVIVFFHRRLLKFQDEKLRILEILADYNKKKHNELTDFEFDGSEFLSEEYIKTKFEYTAYLEDLHIIGKNSLFKFLNQSVSRGGRLRLFEVLANPAVNSDDIELNQQAIEDISSNILFILHFQQELRKIKRVKDRILSQNFLASATNKKNKAIYGLLFSGILSICTIMSLVLALINSVSFAYFEILFIIQLLVSMLYNKLYVEEFDAITNDITVLSKFSELFLYISTYDFKASKNIKLASDMKNAKTVLKRLKRLDSLDSLRKNLFSYLIFNVFTSLNAVIIHKYYSLVEDDKIVIRKSIRAIEELEMLVSLSTVNLLKENICKAQIVNTLHLKCVALQYPLINEESCVSNNFECYDDLNIITGSNMSGKTSFMRSVGVNTVLAYAGAYVNAKEFVLPIMKPFTSINVKDDINKGISTFYGELLRIKNILNFAKEHDDTMVVFIDEIFKGTNYADRIFGAKKVLEKLSTINCMVFLTTHDFELCEIEDKKLKNYHFSEEYVNGKMVFSHKIKTGKCQSTNAKQLMEEIGIV